MHIIMTAANCSPAVASRRAKYDDDFRVPTLLDAQPLDLSARVHQRTTYNADMAIEPEKGGKLAHERLQSALPVRAKTRRQPSRLMGPQGCFAGAAWSLAKQPFSLYRAGQFVDVRDALNARRRANDQVTISVRLHCALLHTTPVRLAVGSRPHNPN